MNAKIVLLIAVCVVQANAAPFVFLDILPSMISMGMKNFQDIMTLSEAYGQHFQNLIKQQMYNNVKNTEDMSAKFNQKLKEQAKNAQEQSDKFIKDFQSTIVNGQKFAEDLFKEMQQKFDAAVKDNQQMGEKVQDYLKEQFEEAGKKGKELFEGFFKQMETELEGLKNQEKAFGTDLESQVKEGQKAAANVGAETQANLEEVYEQGQMMMKEGQAVMDAAVKEMTKETEDTKNKLEQVNDDINTKFLKL